MADELFLEIESHRVVSAGEVVRVVVQVFRVNSLDRQRPVLKIRIVQKLLSLILKVSDLL